MRDNLTLTLTPRALERMKSIGQEFQVYIGQVGGGCGAQQAALVRSGAPEPELQQDCTVMVQDDITVWVPDAIEFEDNEVYIDLMGMFFMVVLVALSAVIVQPEVNCGTCGGCASGAVYY